MLGTGLNLLFKSGVQLGDVFRACAVRFEDGFSIFSSQKIF